MILFTDFSITLANKICSEWNGSSCELSAIEEPYINPFVLVPNPSTGIFNLTDFHSTASIDHIVIMIQQGEKSKFRKGISVRWT